jgi:hypothetical protein
MAKHDTIPELHLQYGGGILQRLPPIAQAPLFEIGTV